MVRTPNELFVYWRPAPGGVDGAPLGLRITDLTGRPADESLDGCGFRDVPVSESVYVANLLPGHLYIAEVGYAEAGGFTPLLTVGPVQTPSLAAGDSADFPAAYHRS